MRHRKASHPESALLKRLHATVGEIVGELFELRAGERDVEVLGSVLIGCDERQVDAGLHHARELDLRFFGALGQALHRLAVAGQVDALLFAELRNEIVDDTLVVVVAA